MTAKSWKKKISAAILCGIVGISVSAVLPVPAAEAGNLGSIIGTVIQGAAAKQQVDAQIKYFDQTEEGRQQLFAAFKKKYGVSDNYYRM